VKPTYAIAYKELAALWSLARAGYRVKAQGRDIEVPDVLFIQSGHVWAYNSRTGEELVTAAKDSPEPGQKQERRGAGVRP